MQKTTLNKPTLVFDLDDTLANLRDPMSKAMSRATGKDVHWSQWTTFNMTSLYDATTEELFKVIIEEKLLENIEPYKETSELLTMAKDRDYNVVIVTSRSYHPEALSITTEWFNKYGLPYDEIIVSGHDKPKIKYVDGYKDILMFVDDRIENCATAIESGRVKHTYLYDMPWNINSVINRVKNLKELHKHM